MLGIVVALSWELRILTRQRIVLGSCHRITNDVCVALAGIGAERSHAAAELLLSQGATGLLSWGFAAALDDRLKPGNVMLPQNVIGATGENYPVSVEWHRQLYRVLASRIPVATDSLLESPTILEKPDAKRRLARQTKASAADMESGALARSAIARDTPFAVVRVITDTIASEIPKNVVQALDPSGAVMLQSCLARAFLRPANIVPLIKLARQFNAARTSLNKARAPVLDASRLYLDSLSTTGRSVTRP
ncbi:MAG TPA: phosphorylase [Candidatus Binatia bacterium]|jgi:hopanoid-associated phosphorylase